MKLTSRFFLVGLVCTVLCLLPSCKKRQGDSRVRLASQDQAVNPNIGYLYQTYACDRFSDPTKNLECAQAAFGLGSKHSDLGAFSMDIDYHLVATGDLSRLPGSIYVASTLGSQVNYVFQKLSPFMLPLVLGGAELAMIVGGMSFAMQGATAFFNLALQHESNLPSKHQLELNTLWARFRAIKEQLEIRQYLIMQTAMQIDIFHQVAALKADHKILENDLIDLFEANIWLAEKSVNTIYDQRPKCSGDNASACKRNWRAAISQKVENLQTFVDQSQNLVAYFKYLKANKKEVCDDVMSRLTELNNTLQAYEVTRARFFQDAERFFQEVKDYQFKDAQFSAQAGEILEQYFPDTPQKQVDFWGSWYKNKTEKRFLSNCLVQQEQINKSKRFFYVSGNESTAEYWTSIGDNVCRQQLETIRSRPVTASQLGINHDSELFRNFSTQIVDTAQQKAGNPVYSAALTLLKGYLDKPQSEICVFQ